MSKKHVVYFDFDNTITLFDVFDDMLLKFAVDDKWEDLEEKWKRGEIGSKECLGGQLESIRVTKPKFDKYLDSVKIDPYFKRLLGLFRRKKVKAAILSDNFDYILKRILKIHGISRIKIYSNKAKIMGNRIIPSFPFHDKGCPRCGHCKKNNLARDIDNKGKVVYYYVGDGRSDICPSRYADIVFAKGFLDRYLRKKRAYHVPISGLEDVYRYFKRAL